MSHVLGFDFHGYGSPNGWFGCCGLSSDFFHKSLEQGRYLPSLHEEIRAAEALNTQGSLYANTLVEAVTANDALTSAYGRALTESVNAQDVVTRGEKGSVTEGPPTDIEVLQIAVGWSSSAETSTTIAIPADADIAKDDALVLLIINPEAGQSAEPPSGFTSFVNGNGGGIDYAFCGKIATGSEPGTNLVSGPGFGTAAKRTWVLFRLRGLEPGTVFQVFDPGNTTTGTSTSPNALAETASWGGSDVSLMMHYITWTNSQATVTADPANLTQICPPIEVVPNLTDAAAIRFVFGSITGNGSFDPAASTISASKQWTARLSHARRSVTVGARDRRANVAVFPRSVTESVTASDVVQRGEKGSVTEAASANDARSSLLNRARIGYIGYAGKSTMNQTALTHNLGYREAGETILVIAITDSQWTGASEMQLGLSISGGGLTWQEVGNVFDLYEPGETWIGNLQAWVARVQTSGSLSVSIDAVHSGSSFKIGSFAYRLSNVDEPSRIVGGYAESSHLLDTDTVTLSSTPSTDSLLLMARLQFQGRSGDRADPGSGWTEITDVNSNEANDLGLAVQYRSGTTSTSCGFTDAVVGATVLADHLCVAFAVEFKVPTASHVEAVTAAAAQAGEIQGAGGTTYNESRTESVTSDAAQSAVVVHAPARSEAATAAASQSSTALLVASRAEAGTLAALQSSFWTGTRGVSEAGSAAATQSGGLLLEASRADGVTAGDNRLATLTAVGARSEAATAAAGQAAALTGIASRAEAVAASDALASAWTGTRALSESATAGAAQAGSVGKFEARTEAATATAAEGSAWTGTRGVSEAASATANQGAVLVRSGSLTEAATAAASQSGGLLLTGARSEPASATAAQSVVKHANAASAETASAQALQSALGVFVRSIAEISSAQVGQVATLPLSGSRVETVSADASQSGALVRVGDVSETAIAAVVQAVLLHLGAQRTESLNATFTPTYGGVWQEACVFASVAAVRFFECMPKEVATDAPPFLSGIPIAAFQSGKESADFQSGIAALSWESGKTSEPWSSGDEGQSFQSP